MSFQNEGVLDRLLRLFVAMWLLALGHGWIAALGVILLMTGAIGYCPLYRLLGVNTSRTALLENRPAWSRRHA
jgi:hypothetical protein